MVLELPFTTEGHVLVGGYNLMLVALAVDRPKFSQNNRQTNLGDRKGKF